jgi:hypothetical protein
MPVDARRFIRKMRGGAQAHLLEASDGHFYVVKFRNNPQHRRILINEWISSVFLDYLGLAAPRAAIVRVSESFLEQNPEVHFQAGTGRIAVEPGWHFGSRFPGDPARTVVYDFLPDSLIERVENLADFRGMLAFDKWMGNADARQAIFFRARLREFLPPGSAPSQRLGFVAQMMDNGYVFEGPHWRLSEAPLQGLYFRPMVYRSVRDLAGFEPWLDRIRHFPEEVVDQAVKQIPESWLEQSRFEESRVEQSRSEGNPPEGIRMENDREQLENLLERLLRRRSRVPDLIADCRAARSNPFPEWRS